MEKIKRAATGRDSEKYIVRFPEGMRDRIAELAKANNRSMNAEIIARLEMSFAEPDAAKAAERRKLELVNSYVEWCRKSERDPFRSFSSFCKAYEEDEQGQSVERINSIPAIDPKYLSDLFSIWIVERPTRFPALSDSRPALFTGIGDLRSALEPDPEELAEISRKAAEWGCSKTRALIRMTLEEIEAKRRDDQ